MLVLPSEIDIHLPSLTTDSSIDIAIPIFTTLFRRNCHLNQALGAMYERNPDADKYTIFSAACSVGAGVDSLLALHERHGNRAELEMIGCDINPDVLKKARAGNYVLTLYSSEQRSQIYRNIDTLINYGFKQNNEDSEELVVFSSENLRSSNQVKFIQADISCDELPSIKPDLIEATNVLYHLSPSKAWKVVDRLAAMLSANGVLNLSGARSPYFITGLRKSVISGRLPQDMPMLDYGSWRETTIRHLEETYNLKPVIDTDETALIFSRK